MELLNKTDCAVKIVELGKHLATAQADIHLCACSSLAHCRDHGDYRTALQLMNALPNGVRVQALAVWYREYSNGKFTLAYDNKDKTWKGSLKKDRSTEDFKIEDAMLTSFADFTKESTPKTMTVEKLLAYLTRVANNTEVKGGKPAVDEPTRALASRLHRMATEPVAA